MGDVSISYLDLMLRSLRLYGRYMYERNHTVRLIKMVEAGLLPLGEKVGVSVVGTFNLTQIYDALELAEKEPGWGRQVLLLP
jgi:hypothetical protein